jgi:transcriptional regulator with XRE-family HTH domain
MVVIGDLNMKTSDKIRKLRIEKGLSQEALGKLLGVKKAAINKYETGRVVNIKKSTLIEMARVFGVSPAELLDDAVDISISSLTKQEEQLLLFFRELNAEGREELIKQAHLLIKSGEYKKHSQDELAAEA